MIWKMWWASTWSHSILRSESSMLPQIWKTTGKNYMWTIENTYETQIGHLQILISSSQGKPSKCITFQSILKLILQEALLDHYAGNWSCPQELKIDCQELCRRRGKEKGKGVRYFYYVFLALKKKSKTKLLYFKTQFL